MTDFAESIKIRLEKEAETSTSRTVPQLQLGGSHTQKILANYPNPHVVFVFLLTEYSEVRFVMVWTQKQYYST